MCALGGKIVGVTVDWYCGCVVVCGRSFFGVWQDVFAVGFRQVVLAMRYFSGMLGGEWDGGWMCNQGCSERCNVYFVLCGCSCALW